MRGKDSAMGGSRRRRATDRGRRLGTATTSRGGRTRNGEAVAREKTRRWHWIWTAATTPALSKGRGTEVPMGLVHGGDGRRRGGAQIDLQGGGIEGSRENRGADDARH
ncbi:hypothetical protein E2562_033686 [Oryza meyeriana var. granulata]|uniref:DUF834 domain-containing protein n=1 Tax=Oryza meyeriana var. granulata TaxID=110450 RepID=A0A6G1DRH8_9ORYZ|nr:hypothetical protein E2562_033686 [Oryza meyeriana var. granulata]